jgi:ubiquinone/menaquinone biosynthesis C-methylase UbiE
LPFKGQQFDGVVCCGVLQYLEDERFVLQQMSRVVKDGGFVIVTFPNMLRLACLLDPAYYFARLSGVVFRRLRKRTARSEEVKRIDWHGNRDLSDKRYLYWSLDRVFSGCGLRREATVGIGFGPLTFRRYKLLPGTWSIKMSRILTSLANKRNFGSLRILANRWVVQLRKESK